MSAQHEYQEPDTSPILIISPPAKQEDNTDISDIITKVFDKTNEFVDRIHTIKKLVDNDNYKHLSKKNRNALIMGLLHNSRDIEDLAKVAFRSLKKIKRKQIQDEDVDSLLGFPDRLKAKGDEVDIED